MKSKREKMLTALEDSEGCLQFWTSFAETGKTDCVYVESNKDLAFLAKGKTKAELCGRKIAHHKRVIGNLKVKLGLA